jgi:hypothetical protein
MTLAVLGQKKGKQRRNSGRSAVISAVNRPKVEGFRGERDPRSLIISWKNSENSGKR